VDIRANGDISWDKFALIYDILNLVSECQSKDPSVSGAVSETFRKLILDTPIIDHEDVSPPKSGTWTIETGLMKGFIR
jgi:hypothetical protein